MFDRGGALSTRGQVATRDGHSLASKRHDSEPRNQNGQKPVVGEVSRGSMEVDERSLPHACSTEADLPRGARHPAATPEAIAARSRSSLCAVPRAACPTRPGGHSHLSSGPRALSQGF
jgi:hypothetical protein